MSYHGKVMTLTLYATDEMPLAEVLHLLSEKL